MREDVKKYLFIGLEDEKNAFLKAAQSKGMIHFINPDPSLPKEIPEDVHRLITAIKVLRGQPTTEQEENVDELNVDQIVNRIVYLNEKNEKMLEEMRLLSNEISRIEAFGNFSLEDIAIIENEGKCKVQFFAARPTLFQDELMPEGLVYVSSEHGFDYYIAINDEQITYEKMIELKFNRSLADLKHEYRLAKATHIDVEHELKGFAIYNQFLHHALIDKLNQYNLYHTETYIQEVMGGSLFALEGWIPTNKMDQLNEIIEDSGIIAEEVMIEPTDVIPTYLENHGQGAMGEDLVHIYDTPSNTDKDPSMWVLYGFALFFAIIIGDAGYGMLYLLLALFLRWKYPKMKSFPKRVLNIFTFLCVACVIWGTLMTSFFGMQIALDNPLRKVSLLQWLAEKKVNYHIQQKDDVFEDWTKKYPELKNVTDVHQFVSFSPATKKESGHVILNRMTDNIMFELALFIGVVHLFISMLRYAKRQWQNIGWAIFLIGAYLYFPSYLKAPSLLNYVAGIDLHRGGVIGLELIFIGIGLAWILSIIRNGWTGLFEVVTLIQVFADTLSYLRLYALGLAGAIVASTVNEIASGMPLIIGIVLVLIAHFINIILATMSGVIHGLRLNFLEWYHYSFEGGGKQFQPLKLLKKE
ncbi:MAG: V-type ATPase 116kDa subunit family protein [Parachlamydiaceae bacterium]|nr:V-type ATPase 116kDa subunit family protein [Parachlamydiaceae bacterium]